MAKKFLGDYKGIEDRESRPVLQLSISLVDLPTGKMVATTATHFVKIGKAPSYGNFMKYATGLLRDAFSTLKRQSESAEEVAP